MTQVLPNSVKYTSFSERARKGREKKKNKNPDTFELS